MTDFTKITNALLFPEGPIAMPDGSVIVVEIARGTLSRVAPDGEISVICDMGGGPNGAAMGPDGHVYVCNNGGFDWIESSTGRLFPGDQAADYTSGRIERVNIETGAFETVYTHCDGEQLKGPNDLVFDREGGFWFTDHGKNRPRDRDRTGVFYAKADGSHIEEAIFPLEAPNGIGLSPDEQTLYVAETPTGRLWAFDIESPGKLQGSERGHGGRMLAQIPDHHLFDSLAVDGDGNICVATIITGGITVHSPDGANVHLVPLPDPLTTNICFGGDDLRTAYATLSSTGALVSFPWHCAGLPLNFLNT